MVRKAQRIRDLVESYAEVIEGKEEDPRRTKAPKKDRIKGSKTNAKGSASSTQSASSITFSDDVEKGLRNKISGYNDDMAGKEKSHKVTMPMLKAVFRRGLGAFSSSHLPGMSRNGWAYARVNAFLHLVKTGKPKKAAYVQDNDLLPSSHPRSTKTEGVEANLDRMRLHLEHTWIMVTHQQL